MKITKSIAIAVIVGVGLIGYPANAKAVVPINNQQTSVSSSGTNGNGTASMYNSVVASGDGRYIVFASNASNLVSGDTNNVTDVFLRDMLNGTTTRVSLSSTGTQATTSSTIPSITYDGRYVFFESTSNLIPGIAGAVSKIYVRDTLNNTTELVSKNATGVVANLESYGASASADGRFVTFYSRASNLVSGITPGTAYQVFLKDMYTGAVKVLSVNSSGTVGNGTSNSPAISCDGGVVTFASSATNLVSGDTNAKTDVFMAIVGIGGDELVSITQGGNNNSIGTLLSCNGQYASIATSATNLSSSGFSGGGLRYDRANGNRIITTISASGNLNFGPGTLPSLDDNGRLAVFFSAINGDPADTNGNQTDIYMRDLKTGTTELVSRNANYAHGYCTVPALTAGGNGITYYCKNVVNPIYKLISSESNTTTNYDSFYSLSGH